MSARPHRIRPVLAVWLGLLAATCCLAASARAQSPPVADPGGPYSGNEGQPIAFDGTGSFDPDGGLLGYVWDFGDGTTATGATPSHTYAAGGPFVVTLTVTDPEFLTDVATTTATVNRTPAANPNGPYAANLGQPISFSSAGSSDPDGDQLSYLWDFGDGSTATQRNPNHTYSSGGIFTVTLTVTDPGGLSDAGTTTATVNRPPVANPNGPYTANLGQPIAFSSAGSSDPDGDTLTYRWDFGDGSTSTAANPTKTYATGGVFVVLLQVMDPGGLTNQVSTTATINRPPVAEANGPYTASLGQPINFSSAGSSDPDGDTLAYLWSFGDGTTSTQANPTKTYAVGGVYTVTLRVTDPGGLFAEDTAEATIARPPVANANGPYTGNQGQPIAFSSAGSSDPDGQALTYLWTFGDGTTSTAANPTKTYAVGGVYTVTLRVTDPDLLFDEDTTTATINRPPVAEANGPYTGNQGSPIAFSSAGSSDPDGQVLTYLWTFGDGTTSTQANPAKTYVVGGVYAVTLRVTDPGGLFNEDTAEATVNRPPVAEANGPYTGNQGSPIAFSSAGSSDPDGQALTYLWTFGDGTTSTAANPTKTYAVGGVYTVTLRVTDPGGLFSEDTAEATVNRPPVAEANGPYTGNQGQAIAFSSAGSSDPEGGALTYLWNFGDGSTSTAANPSHTYATGGVFAATLRVTDPGGLFSEDAAAVRVNRPPVAEANGPYTASLGQPINFLSAGSSDPDGDALAYLWTFGDGTTSTAANPTKTYAEGGVYTVTLRVTDPGGLFAQDTTTATIARPPVANANGPYAGNQGQPIAFSSAGSSDPDGQALTYLWTFGDGTTSTAANPTKTYAVGGVYTVTLRVTDPDLLFDEDTTTATINRPPVAEANGPYTGNAGQPIAFSSAGSSDPEGGALTYLWTFGDGTTSTAANPAKTYAAGGVYAVTLRVTDPGGLFNEDTAEATVNRPPVANANGPYAGNQGSPIAFSSAGSSDPDGQALTYLWTFGDGTTSTQANPAKTYAVGGVYAVTLRVTDPGGLFNEDTAQATVNRPPVAEAGPPSAPIYNGDRGVPIAFSSAGSSDPDGDALTYLWEFGDGTTSTQANPSKTYAQGGAYTATLRVRDPGGLIGTDTAPVLVNDLVVTAPAAGVVWSEGSTQSIQWTAIGSIGQVAVEYRLRPTSTWTLIGTAPADAGSLQWQVPDIGSADETGVLVRVRRAADPQLEDRSDPFTIRNRVLTVTAPASGDSFYETTVTDIRWTSVGFVSQVRLEVRLSPTGAWQQIAATEPNDGRYTWTVPEVAATQNRAQVRILDAADTLSTRDTSDEFTIRNRSLAISSPSAGVVWSEASSQTIEWTVNGPVGDVAIEFRRNPLEIYQEIARRPATDGSYVWLVAAVTQDQPQAQVRIRELDPRSDPINSESQLFIIQNRALSIVDPAPGSEISERIQTPITWSSAGLIDNVRIEFRRRPADAWEAVAASVPNSGSYQWNTPEVAADEPEAQIRITDVAVGPDLAQALSQPFTLVNRTLTPVLPAPGSIECEADTVAIVWETRGSVPTVDIEWRIDPDSAWNPVVTAVPNTGSALFPTPDVPATSDQVQLRVRQATDQTVTATWSPFTLTNRAIAFLRPVGGETYTEGDAVPVSWLSDCIDSVLVEARIRPGAAWVPQGPGVWPNTEQIIWTVLRVDQEENAVQLRISDASDPGAVLSVSNPFTVLNRVLDVVRPTVTDSLSETTTFRIEWDWAGTLQRVSIDYRLDPALDWVPITSNVANTGSYNWQVPLVDRDYRAAQIRVTDTNNPGVFDEGDPFIIMNRALLITRPAVLDTLTETAADTIRWSTRGEVPVVTVSYRESPSDTWQVIASEQPNTGFLPWVVPAVNGDATAARVRLDYPAAPEVTVESGPFVILDRAFLVLSPAGGESWSEATTQLLRWRTVGEIDSVRIELVLPGGGSQVLFPSTPNDGEEPWLVPELSLTLPGVRIRVIDPRPPSTGATSQPFTLVNRSLTITAPASGARVEWRIGSTQAIRWATAGVVDSVSIELGRDGPVGSFETVVASTPNDGEFLWLVTAPETFNAVLRMRGVGVPDVVAITPSVFAIYDLVPPDLCADFDHSGSVTLDELVRVESIIIGDAVASEADSLAADGTRDALIDVRDILCGVDDMIAGEIAGRGRPFVDAGFEESAAHGALIALGPPPAAGIVPIEITTADPLAGLLVAVEVEGGSADPELGPDGEGLVMVWTATGPGRLTATVRRTPGGPVLAAGTSWPLQLRVRAAATGDVMVRVTRAEAVGVDANPKPVHLLAGEAAVLPLQVALGQNRPNPFNPSTVIPFELPAAARVELRVHDVGGRLIKRVIDGATFPAGYHSARWDGRDERGLTVASGVYLATLRAGGETFTRKMMVIR